MNKIKILIPVYNDWRSVFKLLENINLHLNGLEHEVAVLIVNDASTQDRPDNDFNLNNLFKIKRNDQR